ncbi:MAG: hypothetical protein NTW87_21325 [Planctomycetota bacterium]|nr:hypothetical protein [Planctomycetota bacterium]
MRKAQVLLALPVVLAALAATCAEAPAANSETDTEELIRRLNGNDFETREQATLALGERAEKIWGRLKELAKSTEPEVRLRAKRAMFLPTQRRLTTLLEEATKELQAAEKAIKDKEALQQQQAAYRLNHSRLTSRIDQIKQALADGETFEPGALKDWGPSLLPFARRLKCRVSFEFVDVPLDKAAGCVGEWAGLNVTVDEAAIAGGAPAINLRVSDMSADLALEWICKLADLEYSVDQEAQKIVVRKPR